MEFSASFASDLFRGVGLDQDIDLRLFRQTPTDARTGELSGDGYPAAGHRVVLTDWTVANGVATFDTDEQFFQASAAISGITHVGGYVGTGLRESVDDPTRLGRDPTPIVVRAGTEVGGSETYGIVGEGEVHPDYDDTPQTEDVGLLRIDGSWEIGLDLLSRGMVDDLDIGQPAGTLGLPAAIACLDRDAGQHQPGGVFDRAGDTCAILCVDRTGRDHGARKQQQRDERCKPTAPQSHVPP